jgi:peptide deformylase
MIREIKVFDDPVLRKKSKKVERIDPYLLRLLDDMAETMYAAPGIGLAAPQVGVNKRVIVVDVGEGLHKLINPKIIHQEGSETATEGCLSVPGILGDVERSSKITVKAQLPDGKFVKIEAEGLFAVCLQHEIDHLEGTLFIDKSVYIRDDGTYEEDLEEEDEAEEFDETEMFPQKGAGIPLCGISGGEPAIFEKQ